MMKTILIIIVLTSLLLSGCARILFNPDTGEFCYTRIGDQQIEALHGKRSGEDFEVSLGRQQADADQLNELIKSMTEVLTRIP